MQESTLESDARLFRRNVFNNAVAVDVDEAGRFVIPEAMRKSAGINTKVVLAGMGDAFELWSQERYQQVSAHKPGQL